MLFDVERNLITHIFSCTNLIVTLQGNKITVSFHGNVFRSSVTRIKTLKLKYCAI